MSVIEEYGEHKSDIRSSRGNCHWISGQAKPTYNCNKFVAVLQLADVLDRAVFVPTTTDSQIS